MSDCLTNYFFMFCSMLKKSPVTGFPLESVTLTIDWVTGFPLASKNQNDSKKMFDIQLAVWKII